MKRYRAVATWTREDYEGWEIEFLNAPDGHTHVTCTGDGQNTKQDAESMARDLVTCWFDRKIRGEDVKLTIEWKNERQYQRWHERRFGMRDWSR